MHDPRSGTELASVGPSYTCACLLVTAPYNTTLPHLQDPILRYGGMFVLGLAYCGTSNNAAIQKLLHFAVSGGHHCSNRAHRLPGSIR